MDMEEVFIIHGYNTYMSYSIIVPMLPTILFSGEGISISIIIIAIIKYIYRERESLMVHREPGRPQEAHVRPLEPERMAYTMALQGSEAYAHITLIASIIIIIIIMNLSHRP